jgi:hypothetical protein
MILFKKARDTIYKDVDTAFEEIKNEVSRDYLNSNSVDMERIQNAIRNYVPSKVSSKNLLLLDTVFNYLNEDAINFLSEADNQVANDFYEQNQYWMERLKSDFQDNILEQDVPLSFDPRIGYSTGASISLASVLFVLKMLFRVEFFLLSAIITLVSLGAGFATYQNTAYLAVEVTEKDLDKYLQQALSTTKKELEKIILMYEEKFKLFLHNHEHIQTFSTDL